MHILTGLVLAGLTGMKTSKNKINTPGFSTGPLQTVHSLPGRVRFRVPSLTENDEDRELIETKLSGVEGIGSVTVSPVTGSVLVLYDESEVQPGLLFAAVARLLGLEKELENPPPPLVAKELTNVAESMNRAVYERTGGIVNLWTALMIGLAVFGVRKVLTEGSRAWPAGFTLVWWATNAIGRQK